MGLYMYFYEMDADGLPMWLRRRVGVWLKAWEDEVGAQCEPEALDDPAKRGDVLPAAAFAAAAARISRSEEAVGQVPIESDVIEARRLVSCAEAEGVSSEAGREAALGHLLQLMAWDLCIRTAHAEPGESDPIIARLVDSGLRPSMELPGSGHSCGDLSLEVWEIPDGVLDSLVDLLVGSRPMVGGGPVTFLDMDDGGMVSWLSLGECRQLTERLADLFGRGWWLAADLPGGPHGGIQASERGLRALGSVAEAARAALERGCGMVVLCL